MQWKAERDALAQLASQQQQQQQQATQNLPAPPAPAPGHHAKHPAPPAPGPVTTVGPGLQGARKNPR